jgi:hypothetical protein
MKRLLEVCLAAAIIACGGDGGTSSANPPTGGGQNTGYSVDQKAFIDNRGNPPQFTIAFAPRRIETWFYNLGQLRAVVFDNGFFIKEDILGPSPDLKPTRLTPAQFNATMTQSDVEAILGRASCEQPTTLGRSQMVTLRYRAATDTPVNTVVLLDGKVASVTAGYAIRTDGSSSTDICSTQ